MGTEEAGPLLAALIRFARPQRVLEVGMGYTTPLLAAALADVRDEAAEEASALVRKTRSHLADGSLDEAWLLADPPLVDPAYHLVERVPHLVAVDDLSIAESSADRVAAVLREWGLDELVTVVDSDVRRARERLPVGFAPIDLAWVDAWECLYFFDHFWDLINPAGGLVVFHYLVGYPEGEAVLRYLKRWQQTHHDTVEVMNLVEPHKMAQNSLTVLRRTTGTAGGERTHEGGEVVFTESLHAAARSLRDRLPIAD
ncbi:hypothetical protein ACIGNX_01460 [Actinosynnema sp. NPDC053489]|uniref:hypothetical protein n=1 Tax=Actinosynnema sp. NPDC053489 TaxID=3363916 RepID=UPI0037C89F53